MTSARPATVACTCGIWAGSVDFDRCPSCGAERLANRGVLDFAAAPWEELDVRGRRYGVFHASGCSPDPIAIFRAERDCDDWITWQRSRGDGSQVSPSADVCVMPIERVSGIAWNDLSTPPAPSSPWPNRGSTPVDLPDDPTPEVASGSTASTASGASEVAVAALYTLPIVGCVPLIVSSIGSIFGLDPFALTSYVVLPTYVACSAAAIGIIRRAHQRVTRC